MICKANINIKNLKDNFIKKYSLHQNYFKSAQKAYAYDQQIFDDADIFLPKSFQRKNNYQYDLNIKNSNKKNMQSRADILKNIMKRRNNSANIINYMAPGNKVKITPKTQRQLLIQKYHNIPIQPSFVKKEKLKRKALSTKQEKRFIPKYAASLMKPCNIQTIKIQKRPKSAINRAQIFQNTPFNQLKARKKQLSQDFKESIPAFFQPWQTQQQEY